MTRVTIYISGFNIQSICADGPVEVLVLDWEEAEDEKSSEEAKGFYYRPVDRMTPAEMDAYIEKTNQETKEELSKKS